MTRRPSMLISLISLVGCLVTVLAGPGFVRAANDPLVADRVLGQPDFEGDDCPDTPTASSLCSPASLALTANRRLFVADSDNNRVLSWPDAAALVNGQAADLVLGQPDFASSDCNRGGITASTLCSPTSLAVDAAGRLYVADADNNRVLIWSNADGVTSGQGADLVIGQAEFTTKNCPTRPTASIVCGPTGVTVGADGRLYVSDGDNNRVLIWTNAAALANGAAAELVLGQKDFRGSDCPKKLDASSICGPSAIRVTPQGKLLIADTDNSRLLIWNNAAGLKNGQPADLVLGQANFADSDCADPPVAENICSPSGMAVTPSGRLLVADFDNNRVLGWPSLGALQNGQPPDWVLGQAGFATSDCPDPATASTVCGPNELLIDASGALWVVDSTKNRVLRFPAAP